MKALFPEPLIPGLAHREDIIDGVEEDALLDRLQGLDLSPFRFHGWIGNRKTLSFGWRYDFEDGSFEQAEPIPDWLRPLRDRAAALADVATEDLVHALLARYDPGAGIGWHRDRPLFEDVIGISLGSAATIRFRQRTESGFRRASLLLEPRSAYVLRGEVRHDWEHSIAAGEKLRFSITFRTLSDLGRRKIEARAGH